jgi:acylphosphatase
VPDEVVRVRVVVGGRVQGVWFRQSTVDAAREAGVAGWVRNLTSGDVEAVFEGSRAAVERALQFVATGPSRASVEHIDTTWEAPAGEQGFTVR